MRRGGVLGCLLRRRLDSGSGSGSGSGIVQAQALGLGQQRQQLGLRVGLLLLLLSRLLRGGRRRLRCGGACNTASLV